MSFPQILLIVGTVWSVGSVIAAPFIGMLLRGAEVLATLPDRLDPCPELDTDEETRAA